MNKKRMLTSALVGLALLPAAAIAQSTGVASWYGARHQGLRTSSGETFEQDGLTAASHTLPLGARVRVTLHETGRSVVVRVNDRMGARNAIIDLSRGAAQEIGLLGRGRGTVSIDSADTDPVEVADAPDAAPAASEPARRHSRLRARREAAVVLVHHLSERRPARHHL